MKPLIVTIDGPSGAGKGTVARAVAAALDYRHIDSGAMYRAVGWKASRDGVALDQEAAVAKVARESVIDVSATAVTIDGLDVTRQIRTPEIDRASASVARLPRVREVLVARQREIGSAGSIVMEGRDIGRWCFRPRTSRFTSTRHPTSERAAAPTIRHTPAVRRKSPRSRR